MSELGHDGCFLQELDLVRLADFPIHFLHGHFLFLCRVGPHPSVHSPKGTTAKHFAQSKAKEKGLPSEICGADVVCQRVSLNLAIHNFQCCDNSLSVAPLSEVPLYYLGLKQTESPVQLI